ncbi:DnaJ domain containing protein [Nitzschia inconspicua]|uniref:DnaJ domain containing protein n=1 Tax=Nitzschia inconspicua TaxID=303405 RepID=A0A9K3PIY1_9STRA|nr:DnaJ domain containing protein [Nitzschia inconspicua]
MNRRRPPRDSVLNDPIDILPSISDIDVVDNVEVVLAPNFDSDNPFEVLGCSSGADPEQLDRAYRDLSRKYHPENTQQYYHHDDSSDSNSTARNLLIFQKIGQAYAQATGKEEIPRTQEAAERAYENKFGKYRELYYNEGGLIGIPYPSDLNDTLISTEHYRKFLSLPLCRLGESKLQIVFFRTWLIKKELSIWLCLAEIFLTWTVIALCALTFLLEQDPDIWPVMSENEGQILDIAGGIALMFAQFILCFWYGFCRYPAGCWDYFEWLYHRRGQREENSTMIDEDMEEIRDVCSRFLHGDDKNRFRPCIVWMCFPVVIGEQLAACCTSWIASACCILTSDEEDRSYGQHLSKSIAGLIVVMGYYLLWMYGNIYCKLAGAAALVLSQKLYSAILFEKGIFEFLQSFLFCDVMLVTLQEKPRRSKPFDKSKRQLEEEEAKDRTLSVDDEERFGVVSMATDRLDVQSSHRNGQRVARILPTGEITEEAGTLAAIKQAAWSENTTYAKKLSFNSSSKTRSLSSFRPLAMFKSSTFPLNRESTSTPPGDADNDNVSLDLSHIDHGEIETFVEVGAARNHSRIINKSEESDDIVDFDDDETDDDDSYQNTTSEGLNAQEILEDLAEVESSNSDVLSEANQILSVYKATKRRIEEAFFASTRVHVVGNANSDDSSDSNVSSSNMRVASLPSRTRTIDSYDFTFEKDDDSDAQRQEGSLSPVLRVFDDCEDSDHANDVEVDGNGKIMGEETVKRLQNHGKDQSQMLSGKRAGKLMWNI